MILTIRSQSSSIISAARSRLGGGHGLAARRVLARWLSNTMDIEYCLEALTESLARYGTQPSCVRFWLDDSRLYVMIP